MAARSPYTVPVLLAAALLFEHAGASPSLDSWVTANASPTEKTVCTREEHGELFFVATAGPDKVRLGSRLDMTGYHHTHEFSVGWILRNERGSSIVAKVRPETIKERYVKEEARVYAESVEYQTLSAPDSKRLRVEVKIGKCAVWSPDSQTCKSGQKAYTVSICEVEL